MDPIWLDSYPPGIPHDIELDPGETLPDALEAAMQEWPNHRAFTNMGVELTYADIDRLSLRFAVHLQKVLGLEQGDRVAIMMPNLLQYPVALVGCLRAGMVAVNVNPLYTPRELSHQLHDSGAKAIVIFAGSAHVLSECIADTDIEHVLIAEVGDFFLQPKRVLINLAVRYIKRMVPDYNLPDAKPFRDILEHTVNDYRKPQLRGSDLAVLQYTGGTTGLSKGAMLTHANILANMRQVSAWLGGNDLPGREIIITALPLYHVFAMTVNFFSYFQKGAMNVLITDPRDTKGMLKEIGRWPFTAMTGVNTLFQSMVRHPDISKLNFRTLKIVVSGGMATQQATAQEWLERSGTKIIEGYGLSETSPVVAANPLDLKEFNGCIGLPLPGTLVSVRDSNNKEVPLGEPGELCVKGPQVMPGYWKNDEATAKVMTDDGYLLTGDIAVMDERGYLKIVDRKKDMIIVSGFNVYPNEIENFVTGHPDILEAACIGVPDEQSGEDVKLFVVMKPGSTMSPEDVRRFCKENMTPYKVPRFVEFVDDMPKSNVGKILRRELRDMHAATDASTVG